MNCNASVLIGRRIACLLSDSPTSISAEQADKDKTRRNRLIVKSKSSNQSRNRLYSPRIAIDAYNQRAIDALKHAQHKSGARSAMAFARLLAERTGGAPSSSAYRRWITGEAVIPAWGLEVAAEVTGTTTAQLLEAQEPADTSLGGWRTHIEEAIGHLETDIIEIRQQLGMPRQDRNDKAPHQTQDTPARPIP